MSKFAQYWPTVRQVLYGLAVVGLAVGGALGYFTEAESAVWLERVGTWLGAVGLIIAGLYVKHGTAEAVEVSPPRRVDVVVGAGGSGGNGGWPGSAGGGGGVTTFPIPPLPIPPQVQSTVEQARAEIERRLGR